MTKPKIRTVFTEWGLNRLTDAQQSENAILIAKVGFSDAYFPEVHQGITELVGERVQIPVKNVTYTGREVYIDVDLPQEQTGRYPINSFIVYDSYNKALACGNIESIETGVWNRKYTIQIVLKLENANEVFFYEMNNYNSDLAKLHTQIVNKVDIDLDKVINKVDRDLREYETMINNTRAEIISTVNETSRNLRIYVDQSLQTKATQADIDAKLKNIVIETFSEGHETRNNGWRSYERRSYWDIQVSCNGVLSPKKRFYGAWVYVNNSNSGGSGSNNNNHSCD